jgi:hypothetical protein
MAYLGNTPTTQSFISGTDYFNGTGAQTAFTLTRTVASVNDIEAVVNNVVQQPNDAYNISGTTITFTSAPSAGTNNVYVRYLSTTTQAITPSQNTVNYNTFDSNMQSAIGTGNKNRIINGAMVIDQRNAGASVTQIVSGVYGVDRWFTFGQVTSKFTYQQVTDAPSGFKNSTRITSSSAYTVGSSELYQFTQNIEGLNVYDFGWGTASAKTVTLSFWVKSSLTGTFGVFLGNSAANRLYPASYTINAANTWEQKSVTIAGDTTGTWLTDNGVGIRLGFVMGAGSSFSGTANAWNAGTTYAPTGSTSVVGTNGATFFLTGVQLEVGTQATSFEYRQYQQELALCQRYYYRLKATAANQIFSSGGQCASTTDFVGFIQYPVTMRTPPTALEQSGTAGDYRIWSAATGGITVSSVLTFGSATTPSTATVNGTVASGIVAGNSTALLSLNTNAYLGWSAEL